MPVKSIFGSRNFKPSKKSIVALGVFDGVHRGHRNLFRRLTERARKVGGTSVAYTFDPHPVKVLVPNACPPMINTIDQRIELIGGTGVQRVVVERFTKKFSQKTPEFFFSEILVKHLKAAELFVGYNFTFGVHRSGTIHHLKEFAARAGMIVHVMEPYLWGETLVSSTHVRQRISQADLEAAEDLLDRPYFIEGKVIRGRGIGGKELGVHTANLMPDNDLMLPTGVYATRTHVLNKSYLSLTNIGMNPTFGGASISIETHILNFNKKIVGKKIRVEFLTKLREEQAFSSPQALAQQIHEDIRVAKKFFAERERKGTFR